jgi:hypothetical protein
VEVCAGRSAASILGLGYSFRALVADVVLHFATGYHSTSAVDRDEGKAADGGRVLERHVPRWCDADPNCYHNGTAPHAKQKRGRPPEEKRLQAPGAKPVCREARPEETAQERRGAYPFGMIATTIRYILHLGMRFVEARFLLGCVGSGGLPGAFPVLIESEP